MKIYTRTGDQGETGLADGRRVAKDAARMETCGTLDELNSLVGVARAERPSGPVDDVLRRIQQELFVLGTEVAGVDVERRKVDCLSDEHIQRLEADIDRFDAKLPRLETFILPGGSPTAAALHLARTVCRRAERRLVSQIRQESEAVQPTALAYLNRLSDLLFVLARTANAQPGGDNPSSQGPPSD
ncbi:MAG: cob(I)yrinic acid a,c-diamide adenosyltransferase [Pirellulales bacterium]|nr:cob(I)yrinic acid a,c-diamide adenosyltransferase [Pirellulales bacterium]